MGLDLSDVPSEMLVCFSTSMRSSLIRSVQHVQQYDKSINVINWEGLIQAFVNFL